MPPPAHPNDRRDDAPHPLQNRVLPDGEIVAVPERGLLIGNRGFIHNPDRTLGVTRWRTKMWISCTMYLWGRRRDVMPARRWTALFFLDEVTALAAGHRPCGYCRRPDHVAFGRAWQQATGHWQRAGDMDTVLHAERVDSRTRRKLTYRARLADLPDGAMVRLDDRPHLVLGGALRGWSWDGYGAPVSAAGRTELDVLTPRPIVGVLAAGYRPYVHPSVRAASLRPIAGLDEHARRTFPPERRPRLQPSGTRR